MLLEHYLKQKSLLRFLVMRDYKYAKVNMKKNFIRNPAASWT